MKKIIPADECVFQFSRSGGAGGQNVNKVSTRVTLTWDFLTSRVLSDSEKKWLSESGLIRSRLNKAGQVALSEQRTRAQALNRELALEKLNVLVNKALARPAVRRRTRVGKGQKEKRLGGKKLRARRLSERRFRE